MLTVLNNVLLSTAKKNSSRPSSAYFKISGSSADWRQTYRFIL